MKHSLPLIFVSFFCLYASTLAASVQEKFLPAPLIKMGQAYGHHVLVAEKSTHRLYLFGEKAGLPYLIKTYEVATGKNAGNKYFQGDHRTPEGIYRFTEFLTHKDLVTKHGAEVGSIYGVGAFVMDYPNPIDRLKGKTGGGIWLHSTNDEPRIDNGLDSRGCIVSTNNDLIDISKYLELNRSQVIVVQDLNYIKESTWKRNKAELESTLENWLTSWKEMKIDQYLSYYNSDFFYDPVRKTFDQFREHKKNIFRHTQKPTIEMRDLTILNSGEYAKVTFTQFYQSEALEDIGKKTLYLKRDEYYKWKIVAELWSKYGVPEENESLAFTPKHRYFETLDPHQILPITPRTTGKQ